MKTYVCLRCKNRCKVYVSHSHVFGEIMLSECHGYRIMVLPHNYVLIPND